MRTISVRNKSGETLKVSEDNILQAEKDGFLPVVSNGQEEVRVKYNDIPQAQKDGFDFVQPQEKPKEYDYSDVGQVAKDVVKAATIDGLPVYGQTIGSTIGMIAGPQGAVIGGGLGQAAGESLRKGLYGVGELITGERSLSDELRLPTREEVAQVASDTKNAFVEGATSELGGQAVSKVVEKGAKAAIGAGKGLKNSAEELYARSLGLDKPRANQIGDIQDIRDVGRFARDQGIITPFATAESMTAKNEAIKKQGGEMMGDVYKQIDDAGASTFNPLETAAEVDKKLGGFYRSPINKAETSQLENTLESIVMRGDKNISLQEAQILKEELSGVANWKKNPADLTPKEKMAQDAYFIVSDGIDKAAEAGAKTIGKEGLEQVLTQGKKLYSQGKTVEKLLINKTNKGSNNVLGLTDFITGAAGLGAAALNPATAPAALSLFVGKKYLDKYGAQQTGIVLDKISKQLLQSTALKEMAKKSPQAFEQIVKSTISGYFAEKEKPAPKSGPDKWVHTGSMKVLDADPTFDPTFLNQIKGQKKFRDILIRASELPAKSNKIDDSVEQIKSSEEYKKFIKEKEKQAQNKEPDQAAAPKIKFPLVVQKDGYTAVVRNADELSEAKSEGWA